MNTPAEAVRNACGPLDIPLNLTVSDDRLTEWEQLANNAEPGPWTLICAPGCYATIKSMSTKDVCAESHSYRNGVFVAAAREAVPALIAEVRRLQSRIDNAGKMETLLRRAVDEMEKAEDCGSVNQSPDAEWYGQARRAVSGVAQGDN